MEYMNRILQGNCIEVMNSMPEKCIDLIFADPPYNLQLENELYRPNETKVDAVDDDWDKFNSNQDYDEFTLNWLHACRRVLKDTGTIWVIGAYHNIFRVGKIMQDLGFWILNDIIWVKTNPMPNFRGVRFTNAHETMIWARKSRDQKQYTFNYQAMKMLNDEKQMRSDWEIPICSGNERCKINGEKAHSTQKPEALLRRVILSSSNIGDTILDPFFGSGTTGAVAKKLKRNWVGIEKEHTYIKVTEDRIAAVYEATAGGDLFSTPSKKDLPKVSFGDLIGAGMLKEGGLVYTKDGNTSAAICADGSIKLNDGTRGSIHKIGAHVQDRQTCNGWDFWYHVDNGRMVSIDALRERYRKEYIY